MKENERSFATISEYISGFPEDVRQILSRIREIIQAAAPDAREKISYQMPTFELNGRNLVHFAAFKEHIGFYPTPSGTEKFRDELTPYKRSKGTIQFPLKDPIPYDLIRRIVQFRVQESMAEAEARKTKKRA